MTIAAEAIDRLHSTADSHHRVDAGRDYGTQRRLAGAGCRAGRWSGVILIPEIPYHLAAVAEALVHRNRKGKRFSIITPSPKAPLLWKIYKRRTRPKATGRRTRRKIEG